jgi:hypothetical protein
MKTSTTTQKEEKRETENNKRIFYTLYIFNDNEL